MVTILSVPSISPERRHDRCTHLPKTSLCSRPLTGTQIAHSRRADQAKRARAWTEEGPSSLGQPVDFAFRYTKHPITRTVVANLILESLFMGHLG